MWNGRETAVCLKLKFDHRWQLTPISDPLRSSEDNRKSIFSFCSMVAIGFLCSGCLFRLEYNKTSPGARGIVPDAQIRALLSGAEVVVSRLSEASATARVGCADQSTTTRGNDWRKPTFLNRTGAVLRFCSVPHREVSHTRRQTRCPALRL